VNPKELATWSLAQLHDRLCEYLYDIYDTAEHPALGQPPRAAFLTRLAETGERKQRMIPYDEDFLIFTMPTTVRGTARVVIGKGVKIHHVYYWCDAFRDPDVQRQQVAVRFDPFDVGVAYAFVHKQWVQCHSEYYAVLKGRSEREVMLATQELRQRYHNNSAAFGVTARHLAEFLQSVEAEETLLTQRLSDLESGEIRRALTNEAEHKRYATVAHGIQEPVVETESVARDELAVDAVYGEF
jgi:putative transposase